DHKIASILRSGTSHREIIGEPAEDSPVHKASRSEYPQNAASIRQRGSVTWSAGAGRNEEEEVAVVLGCREGAWSFLRCPHMGGTMRPAMAEKHTNVPVRFYCVPEKNQTKLFKRFYSIEIMKKGLGAEEEEEEVRKTRGDEQADRAEMRRTVCFLQNFYFIKTEFNMMFKHRP
ncbi:hypothetical protein GOODEAATRI_006910, partial [Goodea atripinnis]